MSDFYVACLGEMVSGDASINRKIHEFDTLAGKSHLVVLRNDLDGVPDEEAYECFGNQ